MYTFKKLLGVFLYPLNAWVAVSTVGIMLCVWKPRRFTGTLVLLTGTVGLWLASLPATGLLLLMYLEGKAGNVPHLQDPCYLGIRYVVVLGNVSEGVRLWRQVPGGIMVVSSGTYTTTLVQQARAMGVPDNALLEENEGADTQDQAKKLKAIVGGERFVLSTWALHMQRTLLIFRKQGLDPVAAPTDFLSHARPSVEWLYPSTSGMTLTRLALHELAGTLWVVVRSGLEKP